MCNQNSSNLVLKDKEKYIEGKKEALDCINSIPLELAASPKGFNVLSKHNVDIVFFTLIPFILISIAIYIKWEDGAFVVGLLTIMAGVIAYMFDIANKRSGIVDAIASEILSIGKVFLVANIIGSFVSLVKKDGNEYKIDKPPHGFASSARGEDYFAAYNGHVNDIGSLSSSIVQDVTSFYTFLKASRDATRSIELWKNDGYNDAMKLNDIVHVVYLCMLCAIHGEKADSMLFRNKRMRNYSTGVFWSYS